MTFKHWKYGTIMNYKRWTVEEEEALMEAWYPGASIKTLAKSFNRSYGSTRHKLFTLKRKVNG